MFPLKQITFRSSQIVEVSWEMQVQILADATTKQGQSVLQGKEIQSSDSTCISPGHSHKTARDTVSAIRWTGFGLVPAPMRVWDAWQTRLLQQSSSLLRPSCQTIGWRYHNQVRHKYFENIEQETELECSEYFKIEFRQNGKVRGVSLTRS